MTNPIAKNLREFNKAQVIPDKRSELLDDILDKEMEQEDETILR